MKEILELCNKLYESIVSCPEHKTITCPQCVRDGFYSKSDDYFCSKKHYYYVMNYGPSYASEIYHYLGHSQILENNFKNKQLKVLSLGCGFAPDLLALNKYIEEYKLSVSLKYTGIDASETWSQIRKNFDNATFIKEDVNKGFDFSDIDIVFIVKLFSNLFEKKSYKQFLDLLEEQIETNLKKNSFLIFNDINSECKGRDKFDSSIKNLFSSKKYYY